MLKLGVGLGGDAAYLGQLAAHFTRLVAIRPSSTSRNSYPDVYCQLLFIRLQELTTTAFLLAAQPGFKFVCRWLAAV